MLALFILPILMLKNGLECNLWPVQPPAACRMECPHIFTTLTYPPNGGASKMNRSNTKPEFPGRVLISGERVTEHLEVMQEFRTPTAQPVAAETSKDVNRPKA